MELKALNGQTCIVTGSTGHIGKNICISLAKAGANIALLSSSKIKSKKFSIDLIEKYKIKCKNYYFDLDKTQKYKTILNKINKDFKSINLLVNCAYYTTINNINTTNTKNIIKGFNGTLINNILFSQNTIKYLKKTSGNIINIGSIYGLVSPDPKIYFDYPINPLTYSVSKSGIIQYTKYAAVSLAKYGIRVNCISPGPFPNQEVQKNIKFISNLKGKIPLNKIGRPKDIGELAVFLASDSSKFITGQNIIIDGGWTSI